MFGRELDDVEVVGSGGWKIGKIKDIILDESTWRVIALETELEKSIADEFQMRHRLSKTRIPLSVTHIQAVGDKVVLKTSKEELFRQVEADEEKVSTATAGHGS